MAKPKTMTINQLHKLLGKLIENGEGRVPVCINKRTFTHPLESDGCCILPVEGIEIESVVQMDGDGFITDANGREHYRRNAVLLGNVTAGFKEVLSTEAVESYIRSLAWGGEHNNDEYTLVCGNIRGFASHIRKLTGG